MSHELSSNWSESDRDNAMELLSEAEDLVDSLFRTANEG
jgi:hypothetical protein